MATLTKEFDGFEEEVSKEPTFCLRSGLWFYGNIRVLLGELAYIDCACGPGFRDKHDLDMLQQEAERLVLDGRTLVCGFHNEAHRSVCCVPLRWGAPRVLVMSGGIRYHLGPGLREEPFPAARLWRYQFDPKTDLCVSRRSPDKMPTFALHNRTVDRLIAALATGQHQGVRSLLDSLPALR